MLIVSWNVVAGLKPALQKIQNDYGSATASSSASSVSNNDGKAKSSSSAPASHPLATYLRLHGNVDVLCLQEHKIPLSQLSSRSEPHRCSTVPGYESFWSCATDSKSKGFNGVVTYARIGTVRSADSRPLGEKELDDQGRAVMTDHGKFVLFNVYVPCGGGSETLPRKMKFLTALKGAMDRQREKGKHVMLAGDMNLKIDKRDIPWKHLLVNVDEILSSMNGGESGEGDQLPAWKSDIAKHWNEISRVLGTLEAMPRQTTNPSTKETFNRFRARVKIAENRFAMLGTYEDTAEEAKWYYSFGELSFTDPETDATIVYRKKSLVSIDTLAELVSKICNVTWSEDTQRQMAESSEAGLNPDSPPYRWAKGLLEEDGMVDVFRHFYPTAEGRFTVWHQLQQKRYINEGSRIDFTFVDRALMEYVEPNDGKTLRCGKEPHSNPLGKEAALLAATAGGLFEGGSFAGGGIAMATKRALDTQFGEAHSGMIYTPPSYSDHIAVSLLMKSSFREYVGQLELESDASTRKAQPHKKQRSIASFLCAPGSKSAASRSSSSLSGEKRTASQESNTTKKKASLYSFFGATGASNEANGAAKESGSSRSSANASTNNKKPCSVPKNSVLNHFGAKK